MKLKQLKTKLSIIGVSLGLLLSASAHAQFEDTQALQNILDDIKAHPQMGVFKSDFGTSTKVTVNSYAAFEPFNTVYTTLLPNGAGISCTVANCVMIAPVHFPDSVEITGYEMNYADFDPANSVVCALLAIQHDVFQTAVPPISVAGFASSVAGTPGGASSGVQAPMTPHVVDNNTYFYVEACAHIGGTRFTSTRTYWERAISAAPGAASYSDVPPSHPFYQAVEAMAASGVTGGCGGGKFCPDANLTRGQMAAFMARALGL